MKKVSLVIAIAFSTFASCTKDNSISKDNQRDGKLQEGNMKTMSQEISMVGECNQTITAWISRNLTTSCSARLPMISTTLKNADATIGSQTITEVQCTINGQNYTSLGYMIGGPINSSMELESFSSVEGFDDLTEESMNGWETRAGYVLFCDGLFYHGMFVKVNGDWVFFPDPTGSSFYNPIPSGLDMDTLC